MCQSQEWRSARQPFGKSRMVHLLRKRLRHIRGGPRARNSESVSGGSHSNHQGNHWTEGVGATLGRQSSHDQEGSTTTSKSEVCGMIDSALAAFGLEDLGHSNGFHRESGFEAVCVCGRRFLSARRPSATRRSWCEQCRSEGKPNLQRQADLRKRRSKIASVEGR